LESIVLGYYMNRGSLLSIIARKTIFTILIIFGFSIVSFSVYATIPINYRVRNFLLGGESNYYAEFLYQEHGFYSSYFDENNETISPFVRYLRWLGLTKKPILFEFEDESQVYRRSGILQGDFGFSWYWTRDGRVGRAVSSIVIDLIVPTGIFFTFSILASFLFSIIGQYFFTEISKNQKGENFVRIINTLDSLPNGLYLFFPLAILLQPFTRHFVPADFRSIITDPLLLDNVFFSKLLPPFSVLVFFIVVLISRPLRIKSGEQSIPKDTADFSLNSTIFNFIQIFKKRYFFILTAGFIIESLFWWPGLASFILIWPIDFIDLPSVFSALFIYVVLAILGLLVLDLLAIILDPERSKPYFSSIEPSQNISQSS